MNNTDTSTSSYPITQRNRAKRVHERARYDHASVHTILDASMLCHVAYIIDGQPYCTPTIHWREGTKLYWHGSSASRMIRTQKSGLAVCLTVSILDGLVMSKTGFHHSVNYRSAMCYGTARIVENPEAKMQTLQAMIERYYPQRNDDLRPFSEQELKATSVIEMEIEEASAKSRTGNVNDEPEDLDYPAWAGVIPVRTIIDKPIPSSNEAAAPMTGDLSMYAAGTPFDQALSETARLYEK